MFFILAYPLGFEERKGRLVALCHGVTSIFSGDGQVLVVLGVKHRCISQNVKDKPDHAGVWSHSWKRALSREPHPVSTVSKVLTALAFART